MTKPPMDLKQFILRQRVLKLYRDIFRSIKEVPSNEDRMVLKNWARNDFKANKHHTDEYYLDPFGVWYTLFAGGDKNDDQIWGTLFKRVETELVS